MKCKNCKWIDRKGECNRIDDYPDPDRDQECRYFKPVTNADMIRRMSDEELAAVIMCPADIDGEICKGVDGYEGCVKCSLKWLGKEKGE